MHRITILILLLAFPAVASASTPQVLSARFAEPVVSGQSSLLKIRAQDKNGVANAVRVRFGDGTGSGSSFCKPFRARDRGRVFTFAVPHTFSQAGTYTVSVRATSGGCHTRRIQSSVSRKVSVRVAQGSGIGSAEGSGGI